MLTSDTEYRAFFDEKIEAAVEKRTIVTIETTSDGTKALFKLLYDLSLRVL